MDDENEGSERYMSDAAWLKSIIADCWADSAAEADYAPEDYYANGLFRLWNEIAASALSRERVH